MADTWSAMTSKINQDTSRDIRIVQVARGLQPGRSLDVLYIQRVYNPDMAGKEQAMAFAATRKPPARNKAAITRPKPDTSINLRVSRMVRDLIDNAASVLGKTRTDFIVESARSHAIDVLLDQRFFSLDGEQYDAFLDALDRPALAGGRLKRLLQTKAPWEK